MRENPRSDAMTGFDVSEGAFFLSPGFQVSCGLAVRLDNRLGLNVRFERERVDWIYGYRHAIFRTNVRCAHSVGSRADIGEVVPFNFQFRGSGSTSGNIRWERASHDLPNQVRILKTFWNYYRAQVFNTIEVPNGHIKRTVLLKYLKIFAIFRSKNNFVRLSK